MLKITRTNGATFGELRWMGAEAKLTAYGENECSERNSTHYFGAAFF